jgi:hypothetical protein
MKKEPGAEPRAFSIETDRASDQARLGITTFIDS